MKRASQETSRPPPGLNALKPKRFLVGKNSADQWVVRDEHGRRGGIFTNQPDALHFARREAGDAPRAIVFVAEPISLFVERHAAAFDDSADAQWSVARH